MGVSVRTAYKWFARYREEGLRGLENRSSRPRNFPHASRDEQRQRIIEQRRARRIYRQISEDVGLSPTTVSRVLRRSGLNRLSALGTARPANRYEHDEAGDLLHLDIKKLGRFTSLATATREVHRTGNPTVPGGSMLLLLTIAVLPGRTCGQMRAPRVLGGP